MNYFILVLVKDVKDKKSDTSFSYKKINLIFQVT